MTRVELGTSITTEQATRAVLRLIKSPIVGDTDKDTVPRALHRLDPNGTIYPMLSKSEQRLVRIALSLWKPGSPHEAKLSDFGGLDMNNRRKVLIVLMYLHLGRDFDPALRREDFFDFFIGGEPRA